MMSSRFVIVLMIAVTCAMPATASQQAPGTRIVEHGGYSDCIELFNDSTRVVLCPAVGGRILEYSLNGKTCLYLDPKQNGWLWNGKGAIDPSGGRFDIGPEMTIPRHPNLWLGKWQGQIAGQRAARLTSREDDATGVQLIHEFTLDKSSSKLLCKQTITNISDRTQYWCHWSRTLALGGGVCVIPLTEPSRFPNKYVMYGPGSCIDYRPNDPNIQVRDGFCQIVGAPKNPKLGMDSHAGWLCYLTTNDLMFIKRFPTYPDRVYSEVAALTISIWYYKDLMCELEPIGPMEEIAPGKSASFTETWWLVPFELPAQRTNLDLTRLADAVNKCAR